ncbi:hypothetical protein HDU67_005717 [Dinochytrium kinnereticum]|nr:hypothetical protein HDU67_005717 [Dinochytrium kinnereticum]
MSKSRWSTLTSTTPSLPLELITDILFKSATSLRHLSHLTSLNTQIRHHLWHSPQFKARVLVKNARKDHAITIDFFDDFLGLPDAKEILRWLILEGFVTPVNCPRAICLTQPLHNRPEILRVLLDGGFPPESSTLLVAANRGYVDIFTDLIVSQGLSPFPFVLTAAAAMGHDRIVQLLLSRNLPPEPHSIIACAGNGHVTTLRLLLGSPQVQSMEKASLSPGLRDASRAGHRVVVEMLLGFGVRDSAAIGEAIREGNVEVVRVLLEAGVVVGALDWAAARKDRVIRGLLRAAVAQRRREVFGRIVRRVLRFG